MQMFFFFLLLLLSIIYGGIRGRGEVRMNPPIVLGDFTGTTKNNHFNKESQYLSSQYNYNHMSFLYAFLKPSI